MRINRRAWLCGAAATSLGVWQACRSQSFALDVSQTIRVGVIGTGVRGKYLIGNLPQSVQVVAICDCAVSRMESTLKPTQEFSETLAFFREHQAANCATYQDYRRMLDREKLDAVIIATPDHHHVPIAMAALDLRLDVYLEKPLTVTISEGRRLVEMVKQTGRVLQVGSQQRTMEMNRFACEFIRDGGLGKISRVEAPNYPGPLANPSFAEEPIPSGLDWDLFLGSTPRRPHNRKLWVKDEFKVDGLLWRGWDLFRDYSGHMMTNWGAHSLDMVQYALGKDDSGPVKIAVSSEIDEAALEKDWQTNWRLKTPRPTGPWQEAFRFHPVAMQYADGTELRLTPGATAVTFFGEKGRMVIQRNRYEVDPVGLVVGGPDESVAKRWDGGGHVARPHLENWLECIQTRGAPNAPVEVGHRSVTVCHLANISRELRRPLDWDPKAECFVNDDSANELLSRS